MYPTSRTLFIHCVQWEQFFTLSVLMNMNKGLHMLQYDADYLEIRLNLLRRDPLEIRL